MQLMFVIAWQFNLTFWGMKPAEQRTNYRLYSPSHALCSASRSNFFIWRNARVIRAISRDYYPASFCGHVARRCIVQRSGICDSRIRKNRTAKTCRFSCFFVEPQMRNDFLCSSYCLRVDQLPESPIRHPFTVKQLIR